MSMIAASQEALSICTTFGDCMTCCNQIAGINAAPQEALSTVY